jgi:3-oxoacyl-[acyl-carrier protein] reductase
MSDLKDKVALITGSSRGIGAAIVRLFASRGAKVAIHGRDTNAIDAVYTDIERQGGIATKVVADVTKFDQIQAMRQQVERAFEPIDILVTSAGGSFTPSGPLENVTEEGWRAAVEGNLTATFLTIKSVLPSMKARNTGSIITISSAAGRKPHPQAPIPTQPQKQVFKCLRKTSQRKWGLTGSA